MAGEKLKMTCQLYGNPTLGLAPDYFLDRVTGSMQETHNIELTTVEFDEARSRFDTNSPVILFWLFEMDKEQDVHKCMKLLRDYRSVYLVAVVIHAPDAGKEPMLEDLGYANLKGVVHLRYCLESGNFTDISKSVALSHIVAMLKQESDQRFKRVRRLYGVVAAIGVIIAIIVVTIVIVKLR